MIVFSSKERTLETNLKYHACEWGTTNKKEEVNLMKAFLLAGKTHRSN